MPLKSKDEKPAVRLSFLSSVEASCPAFLVCRPELKPGLRKSKSKRRNSSPSCYPQPFLTKRETKYPQRFSRVNSWVCISRQVGAGHAGRSLLPDQVQRSPQNDFEVILVGADGSPKAQANYMKKYKMPWLALTNRSREATQIRKSLEFRISLTWLFWIPIGKSSARTEERNCPLGRSGIRYLEKVPK